MGLICPAKSCIIWMASLRFMSDTNDTDRARRHRFPSGPRHSSFRYGGGRSRSFVRWVWTEHFEIFCARTKERTMRRSNRKRIGGLGYDMLDRKDTNRVRLCKSAEKNCSEAGSHYSYLAYCTKRMKRGGVP